MEQEKDQAQPQSIEMVENKPQVTNADSAGDEIIEVHPHMHWLPIVLIVGGLLVLCAQLIEVIKGDNQDVSVPLNAFFITWGVISLVGILFKKRWALISYFSYRIVAFFTLCIIGVVAAEDDIYLEIGKIMLAVGVFFIPKDGHNVYDLLWHNGVFYEKKNHLKTPNKSIT
jgi:hypothetical protein